MRSHATARGSTRPVALAGRLPAWFALAGAILLCLGLLGCPTGDQSLVYVGGKTISAEQLDADPLAILPTGALVIGQLDAEALFATSFGTYVGRVASNLLPLGQESNFVPSRDVKRIWGATYAMQGADWCAVVQGNFDVAAIEAAAQRSAATPSGVTLVRTSYAGNTIYTVANLGFVVLTSHTILSGNETAMRRALDRLRTGTLRYSLAPWMQELFANENADFVVAGDLSGQGVVEAAAADLPFLSGLRLVRVLGNFRSPGTNVVGSLTYRDEPSAAQGVAALEQLQQLGSFTSMLSALGLAPRVPPMTVARQGHDVAFAVSIDTATASMLLDLVVRATAPAGVAR